MASFKIHMNDGKIIRHDHEGRPGGSYTKEITYVPGFVIIKDEYDKKICYPSRDINRIEEFPVRW